MIDEFLRRGRIVRDGQCQPSAIFHDPGPGDLQRLGRAPRGLRRVAVECFPQRLDDFDGCRPFLSAPVARKARRDLPFFPGLSQAAGVGQDKTFRHGEQVRGCGVFPSYARRLFHFGLVPFHKGEIEPCDQSVVEYGIALEGLPENLLPLRPAGQGIDELLQDSHS